MLQKSLYPFFAVLMLGRYAHDQGVSVRWGDLPHQKRRTFSGAAGVNAHIAVSQCRPHILVIRKNRNSLILQDLKPFVKRRGLDPASNDPLNLGSDHLIDLLQIQQLIIRRNHFDHSFDSMLLCIGDTVFYALLDLFLKVRFTR